MGTLVIGGTTGAYNNSSTTFGGEIIGYNNIIKTGAGKLTLTGSNLYNGTTSILGGTLEIDGKLAPNVIWTTNNDDTNYFPTTSSLTVNAGGTLSGTGTLTGVAVTVASAGTLSPGNSLGTMSLSGSLVLDSGAQLNFAVGGAGASSELSMTSGPLSFTDLAFGDFSFSTGAGFGPGTYPLINFGSYTGSFGNQTGVLDGYAASIGISGDNLVLNVVPEPSTLALLAVGGVGAAAAARSRRRRRGVRSFLPDRPEGTNG